MRIVSLVPSATEIVCALGLRSQLVGRSHECDFPPDVQLLPACTAARVSSADSSSAINEQIKSLSVTGVSLYELNVPLLSSLRPDVIITQAQCDVCAISLGDVEKAAAQIPGPPKIVSCGAVKIADLWKDILAIAEALNAIETANEILAPLKNRLVDVLQKTCAMTRRPTVACLEWLDPLMAAGNWVPELVDFAGGKNLFGEAGKHAPWLNPGDLRHRDPDYIILMPCGFSLERTRREAAVLPRHPDWPKLRAVKSKNVYLTDGNQFFNRPGPRLVDSLEILAQILWPRLFPAPSPNKSWSRF